MTSPLNRDFDDLTFDAEYFDFILAALELDNAEATAVALPLLVGQPVSQTMAKALATSSGLPLEVITYTFTRSRCIMPLRGEISYGGFILNKMPYAVDLLGVYSPARRNVERTRFLREGSARISTHYDEKIIAVQGRIIAAGRSKSIMEAAVDDLQRALNTPYQDFKSGWSDERFYQDTELEGDLQIEWDEYTRNLVTWNARILAIDPFAYALDEDSEVDTSQLSNLGGSDRGKTVSVAPGGTIYNWPVITITFPSGGSSPFGTTLVSVTNETVQPNQTLQITSTFSSGDVIEIDCRLQTVKLNTVLIDFEGTFPYLDPRLGANSITLATVSSAQPTLTIALTWRNRFLS